MSYDFSNIEKDAITRPKTLAWGNWAAFEKPGDFVEGYIRDAFFSPARGMFKESRGITLEQKDGTLVNVAIKHWPSNLEATDNLRLGDPLRVLFKETKKSDYPQPMKIFQFFGKNLEETVGQKNVYEMEKADRAAQKSEAETADKELDATAAEFSATEPA